jgi:hypothetical protein
MRAKGILAMSTGRGPGRAKSQGLLDLRQFESASVPPPNRTGSKDLLEAGAKLVMAYQITGFETQSA